MKIEKTKEKLSVQIHLSVKLLLSKCGAREGEKKDCKYNILCKEGNIRT